MMRRLSKCGIRSSEFGIFRIRGWGLGVRGIQNSFRIPPACRLSAVPNTAQAGAAAQAWHSALRITLGVITLSFSLCLVLTICIAGSAHAESKQDSLTAEYLYQIAQEHLKAGHKEEAIVKLKEALLVSPNYKAAQEQLKPILASGGMQKEGPVSELGLEVLSNHFPTNIDLFVEHFKSVCLF